MERISQNSNTLISNDDRSIYTQQNYPNLTIVRIKLPSKTYVLHETLLFGEMNRTQQDINSSHRSVFTQSVNKVMYRTQWTDIV